MVRGARPERRVYGSLSWRRPQGSPKCADSEDPRPLTQHVGFGAGIAIARNALRRPTYMRSTSLEEHVLMTELKRMGGAEIYADHDPRWPSSDAADPPWRLRPQMHLVWHRSDAQNTPGPGPQNRRSGGLITSSAPAEASGRDAGQR